MALVLFVFGRSKAFAKSTERSKFSILQQTARGKAAKQTSLLSFTDEQSFWQVNRGGAYWWERDHHDRVNKSKPVASHAVAPPSCTTPTVAAVENQLATWVKRHAVHLVAAALVALVAYWQRHVWQPYLDKEFLQHETLRLLHTYFPPTDDAHHALRNLMVYAAGLAVWETLGMSTIPVETAAGMVFGQAAFAASFGGKMAGALLAFGLGRTLLHDVVQRRLQETTTGLLPLLMRYHTAKALPTALLMKFSMFPEVLKNIGTAALFRHVGVGHFLVASMLHGGLFTIVWTVLGMQAVATKDHGSGIPLVVTRVVIPVILAVGMGLPPLLMAAWAKALHAEQRRQQQR